MRFPWWPALAIAAPLAAQSGDQNAANRDSLARHHITPVALHATQLLDEPAIGMPRNMTVAGGILWVSDRKGNPWIHLIDVKTGRLIRSTGTTGNGPGSFITLPQLSVRPGDRDAIWAFDENQHRLTRITAVAETAPQTIPTPATHTIYALRWLGAGALLGVGDLDTNRFAVLDGTGQYVRSVHGELLGGDSVPILVRRNVAGGFAFCASPDRSRSALAWVAAGHVDILDATGTSVAHAQVPFASTGEYQRDPTTRSGWKTPLSWRYYADCVATQRHLYALFVGKRIDFPGGGQAIAADYVHVFDWNGKLEAVLQLDQPMSTFTVSGDSVMYAGGTEVTGIYRFTLPRTLQRP